MDFLEGVKNHAVKSFLIWLAVHTLATYPEMNNPIKMEVGIEECLHIEFEYNKSKYHLKVS